MASELEVGKLTVADGPQLERVSEYTAKLSCVDSGGNQTLQILGNRSAGSASSGTDVLIGGQQSRTTGNVLKVEQGSDTYLTISSSGLATFSNGINLGNQTMSSYQTGVWYPHLYYQNPTGVTIGGTAYALQAVSDYTALVGHYVKVGKLVHVEGYLKANVQNTGSFAVDNIGVQGLPFTHRNLTDANCLLTVNSTGGGGTISGGVLASNSTVAVMQTISGTGNLGATVGASSALRVWINGTYFAET
tara:strand:+ start:541 stop:1281 length:741 start_codon:yes stop_codon:yes gene_type:complete